MLATIADGFSPTFAQASRVVGQEAAVLDVDTAGHFQVFYRPNTELGYINPETGDLLALDSLAGTSVVVVLDGVVSGNVSQLVGQHYSNGQLIADDGGNTLYHKDGSIMRSGGVWTYDAGLPLRDSSGNYFWSITGRSMKSGDTYKHPNAVTFRDTTGSIFYAATNGNTTFYKSSTDEEFYWASGPVLNVNGDYFYESTASLKMGGVIDYPSGTLMVDQNGNPYNEVGSTAYAPFTQHNTFTNSEVTTAVSATDSLTTVAVKQVVGGSAAAYVSRIHLVYGELGDYNENGVVDTPDYVLWRKNSGSANPLPRDNTAGVGSDDYDRWRALFGQTFPAAGASLVPSQAAPDDSPPLVQQEEISSTTSGVTPLPKWLSEMSAMPTTATHTKLNLTSGAASADTSNPPSQLGLLMLESRPQTSAIDSSGYEYRTFDIENAPRSDASSCVAVDQAIEQLTAEA